MNFGIIGNTSKPALQQTIEELVTLIDESGHQVFSNDDLYQWGRTHLADKTLRLISSCSNLELTSKCDFFIALGGDGTMLHAARIVGASSKPILGVNLGKLGFLAEVSTGEIKQCLDEINRGDYFIEERLVLQATCLSDNSMFYALNEIVIDKGALPRVIELETYVDGDYMVTYSADGIILTTPTGSTAYSLAAGGPIVNPKCDVITINPIAPHTLTARPVIVPAMSQIKVSVQAGGKFAHITADGQVEKFYDTPAEFIVQRAPFTTKLVKRKNRKYFDLLRTKLSWGRDARTSKG